mmetsp:Transcript_8889/g.14557  ORF Transcript_8889/g.14557 Transcript_8889/m.14557 type:complete len:209 (-) Transcript_8889:396-1022(-)
MGFLRVSLLFFVVSAVAFAAEERLRGGERDRPQTDIVPPIVPSVVSSLDIQKYIGRWYEIATSRFTRLTFEKDCTCVTADYQVLTNRSISVVNRCRLLKPNGTLNKINGVATIRNPKVPAKLSVTFPSLSIPFPASYWVVLLGPVVSNKYSYAVVSDPLRITCFVLARTKTLPVATFNQIKQDLRGKGYLPNFQLVTVLQGGSCVYGG